jgi:hypothetical protein
LFVLQQLVSRAVSPPTFDLPAFTAALQTPILKRRFFFGGIHFVGSVVELLCEGLG